MPVARTHLVSIAIGSILPTKETLANTDILILNPARKKLNNLHRSKCGLAFELVFR